jgi:hypothetical protein
MARPFRSLKKRPVGVAGEGGERSHQFHAYSNQPLPLLAVRKRVEKRVQVG